MKNRTVKNLTAKSDEEFLREAFSDLRRAGICVMQNPNTAHEFDYKWHADYVKNLLQTALCKPRLPSERCTVVEERSGHEIDIQKKHAHTANITRVMFDAKPDAEQLQANNT